MTKVVHNTELEDRLREREIAVRSVWRMGGIEGSHVVGMECLAVGSQGRLVIVQTFGKDGWECFIQSGEDKISEAVREVIRAVGEDATDPEDEDDSCPKGDPECLGNSGDCHDACSTFAMRAAESIGKVEP